MRFGASNRTRCPNHVQLVGAPENATDAMPELHADTATVLEESPGRRSA